MKVLLSSDEYYPFMFLEDNPESVRLAETNVFMKSYIFDIDEETVKRWKKVMEESEKVQNEMLKVYRRGD